MRLYHPQLDRTHEVESPKLAALYRRSGWFTRDEHDEAAFFVAGSGVDPPQMSEKHPTPSPSAEGFSDAQPQQEE
jgi:hypothetical protein